MVSPARERLLADLSDELQAIDDQGLLRRLTSLEAIDGPRVRIDGRDVVNWCSNDFLGLSLHPALAQAAARAAVEWGIGARASRLLAGTTAWHLRLEESLAAWFGAEAAIVYPSGYLANLGTLGALLGSQDAVFIDRLAHASLFDAARASRATLRVFRHNDMAHLAALLSRASKARRRFIITEGVFSMDGDWSP
ncbi:MAG: pyridoxal phosphate-dependent aminotransferase family protein, partial [Candidatus Omnitrophica bacterium]|nr:pyridoxal phosphate-dependent aminotransferase family protein [Candidatus Omnitrophota bacterium]